MHCQCHVQDRSKAIIDSKDTGVYIMQDVLDPEPCANQVQSTAPPAAEQPSLEYIVETDVPLDTLDTQLWQYGLRVITEPPVEHQRAEQHARFRQISTIDTATSEDEALMDASTPVSTSRGRSAEQRRGDEAASHTDDAEVRWQLTSLMSPLVQNHAQLQACYGGFKATLCIDAAGLADRHQAFVTACHEFPRNCGLRVFR